MCVDSVEDCNNYFTDILKTGHTSYSVTRHGSDWVIGILDMPGFSNKQVATYSVNGILSFYVGRYIKWSKDVILIFVQNF